MELTSIKGVFKVYFDAAVCYYYDVYNGHYKENTPAVKLKHIIVYVLLGGLILAIPGFRIYR